MDHHSGFAKNERSSHQVEADRRSSGRHATEGELLIVWHHVPGRIVRFPTVDISETGARIRTTCCLRDGLTGVALGHEPPGISINRQVMVVWSRAVRDRTGRLDHYEAGFRFF